MPGPENTFIDSVHRHLPSEDNLHREGMWNMFRGGTPDMWYSAKNDLWVEYKFIRLPKRSDTRISLIECSGKSSPILSVLQQEWLQRRYAEGRNVAVIVGSKNGGVIFRGLGWIEAFTASEFASMLHTRSELAEWIINQTGTFKHELRTTVHDRKSSRRNVQNGQRRPSPGIHIQEVVRTQASFSVATRKPRKGSAP